MFIFSIKGLLKGFISTITVKGKDFWKLSRADDFTFEKLYREFQEIVLV